jgi:hypothetical protein
VTVEIRWARSATKHRISRERSAYVVRTATSILSQPAPGDSPAKSDRLIFLGRDETGTLLEVMAIETDRGVLVIHAMRMRARYRVYLKGDDDANT